MEEMAQLKKITIPWWSSVEDRIETNKELYNRELRVFPA